MKTGKKEDDNRSKMFSRPTTRRIHENSRNDSSASREDAGAELDVCTGSSEAVWNSTDGWSKCGCDASSEQLSEPPFREKDASAERHSGTRPAPVFFIGSSMFHRTNFSILVILCYAACWQVAAQVVPRMARCATRARPAEVPGFRP